MKIIEIKNIEIKSKIREGDILRLCTYIKKGKWVNKGSPSKKINNLEKKIMDGSKISVSSLKMTGFFISLQMGRYTSASP